MNYGNYNVAGTNNFVTHKLRKETKMFCGFDMDKSHGDWQETGQEKHESPSCIRCQRSMKRYGISPSWLTEGE